MTVTTTAVSISYAGDGSSTAFAVPFPFFGPDELAVYSISSVGIYTLLIRGTHYNVSGGNDAVGTVTATTAPAAGVTWAIRRRTARTQQVDYIDFDAFPASTHEQALDRLTLQNQETDESINRAVRAPIGEAALGQLPTIANRALKFMLFDAVGQPTAGVSAGTGVISAAMSAFTASASTQAATALLNYLSTGTGASARGLVSRLSDQLCIFDFGGKGDGITNDAPAFTLAGSSGTKPVIYVPGGTYLLNTAPAPTGSVTWIISENASFTGAGVGVNVAIPGMCIRLGALTSPVGNASPTFCYFGAEGNNVSSTIREFAIYGGVRSQYGNGAAGFSNTDKVALFGGAQAANGSYNIFGLNTSTIIEAGNTTNNGAWGYECDLNNSSANYGNTSGSAGITGVKSSYGIQITGSSGFNNSYALGITQALGAGKWNRGLVFVSSILQSDIESYTSAARWAWLQGTYTYGLDTAGAVFAGAPIRLGNQTSIAWRNAAGSADLTSLYVDSANNLNLANGSTQTTVYSHLYPSTDNSKNLGTTGARWAAVWSATGTIQTSDRRLKTDIDGLPDMLPIVLALQPKTYRWKTGGYVTRQSQVEQDVQVTEPHEVEHLSVAMVDGKPVQTTINRTEHRPVFDDLPVLDEAGQPVMVEVEFRHAIASSTVDTEGVWTHVLHPGVTENDGKYWQIKTHMVPRMTKRNVTVDEEIPRAGERTHWGFLASDVKKSFKKSGRDFAGYVLGEDGTEHLRPDQLVPALWKAVQELAAQVTELQARSPAP